MPRDILRDSISGDWLLIGGAVQFGESTGQHIADILTDRIGDRKMNPTSTIGVEDYLQDERPDDLNHAVRTKIARDGMTLNKVSVNEGKIDIDANY